MSMIQMRVHLDRTVAGIFTEKPEEMDKLIEHLMVDTDFDIEIENVGSLVEKGDGLIGGS